MPKAPSIETLLGNGSKEWNNLRRAGKVPIDQTGATFSQLFSANADLSGLQLIGSEWEKCDLSKVSFREADLSNSYFHGGRLQDCDFRGCKLEGATFEKVKLLRCDFSGATGIEDLELDEVDMDRVVGLNGEEAPPPPPPPAVGITSFTREQRTQALAQQGGIGDSDLPPFRPSDPAGTLLFRGLKLVGNPPAWVLDVPGLRPPLPAKAPPGTNLETMYREAVKTRMENRRPVADSGAVTRATQSIATGDKEVACAVMYLREVGIEPQPSDAAIEALLAALQVELDEEDVTGQVDPRVTGALLELKAANDALEHIGELRMRKAAAQLFTALLEAGFAPDNNWEEAVNSEEAAVDLATLATNGNRERLSAAFTEFAGLPEDVRLRRLAYLAEATAHLETAAGAGQPAA